MIWGYPHFRKPPNRFPGCFCSCSIHPVLPATYGFVWKQCTPKYPWVHHHFPRIYQEWMTIWRASPFSDSWSRSLPLMVGAGRMFKHTTSLSVGVSFPKKSFPAILTVIDFPIFFPRLLFPCLPRYHAAFCNLHVSRSRPVSLHCVAAHGTLLQVARLLDRPMMIPVLWKVPQLWFLGALNIIILGWV